MQKELHSTFELWSIYSTMGKDNSDFPNADSMVFATMILHWRIHNSDI